MVYEDMTYEVILQRMIDRVISKYPNLDTREGSLIFDALAPAALELAILYTELDNARNESFVNTATREYILIGCEQMGIDTTQFEAKAGVHKGVFNVKVPIGSRWNCDIYNYEVEEYIGLDEEGNRTYKMICDTVGTSPNNQAGDLTPITDSPSDLTVAKLTECLIEGENETDDETIKTTYFEHVKTSVSDGNVNQYKRWCNEYPGIGSSKIFPLWNGDNTVKVSILGASNRKATKELVDEFQEYLDPNCEGMGNGVAPIGAFVTVSTATEVPINVTATIQLKDGYSEAFGIDEAISNYLSSIAYNKTQISYMTIGAVILGVDCVESVSGLTINDSTNDITLGSEEIPVLGSGTWVVSNA